MDDDRLQAFSPEWLARFSPSIDGGRYLTTRDCAAMLLLVGAFSSLRADVATNTDLWAEITERREFLSRFAHPDGHGPYWIERSDYRRRLGVAKTRDLGHSLRRAIKASVGQMGVPVVKAEADGDRIAYRLSPQTTVAHPANSPTRRSVLVDPLMIARFATVQSVPVAARALAWCLTECTVGMPIGTRVDRRDGRDRAESVTLRMDVATVAKDLGLAQMTVWKPSLLKLDLIAADLASVGIDSDWSWVYQGRTPVMLIARLAPAAKGPVVAAPVKTHSARNVVKAAVARFDAEAEKMGYPRRKPGRPSRKPRVVPPVESPKPVAAAPVKPAPQPPEPVAAAPAPEPEDDEVVVIAGQSEEDWEREEIDRCWLLERGPLTDDEWHHLMDIKQEPFRRSVLKLPAYIDMPPGWIPKHWRVSEARSEGVHRCDSDPSKDGTA